MLVPGTNTGILVSRRNRSSETEHECRVHRAREREAVGETGFEKSLSPPKLTSGTQIFHSVSAAAIRDDAQVRVVCGRRVPTPFVQKYTVRPFACQSSPTPIRVARDAALANLQVEIGRDLATLTWRIVGAGIAIAGLAVAVLRFLG